MKQPEVWGHGSVLIFLIIVGILLVGPLVMGTPTPPGIPLLMLFPIVIIALFIFLVVTSN
ncbi:uncharacterized protein LOC114188579 [Vigna unguiculata]|uniref:Transmembrane protein n=1 Tax=Vigna unguiculata TaxID=3917 RepID=A0A4D6KU65_VIGUN|nr:uncharacterized protein LOC114188579 [Vigna unguiculata]QCD77304.1 hypothetical protein DEO72_LG1g927 [Vigna unguiculata]